MLNPLVLLIQTVPRCYKTKSRVFLLNCNVGIYESVFCLNQDQLWGYFLWFCAHIPPTPFLWWFLGHFVRIQNISHTKRSGRDWVFYFLWSCVCILGSFFHLEEVVSVHKRTSLHRLASTEQNLPEYPHVFTARFQRLVSWRGGWVFWAPTEWLCWLVVSKWEFAVRIGQQK